MKVILITNSGVSIKFVSSEDELNQLTSNSFEDDVIANYIDLPDGLTLIYNDGDVDSRWSYENKLAKQLTGYALVNPVVVCRFVDSENLINLTDILDVDVDKFKMLLEGCK